MQPTRQQVTQQSQSATQPEIDLHLQGRTSAASLIASSIDETKLDASVNASLDLADSASQPGHTHVISDITDNVAAAQVFSLVAFCQHWSGCN